MLREINRGFWNEQNQRELLQKVGKELNVQTLDDWYKITTKQIRKRVPFIQYYNNSLITALKKLYPQHKWDPLRFPKVPRGYWKDEDNQREFLKQVGKELGVTRMNHWYKISSSEARERAPFIKDYYNGSLFITLKKLYPTYNWDPLRFPKVYRGYWKDETNRKQQLDKVGEALGVKEKDDWYKITSRKFRKKAHFIHDYHNSSLFSALQKLYPDTQWDPLQLSFAPFRFWQKKSTKKLTRGLLNEMVKKYDIKSLYDWYNIPRKEFQLYHRIAMNIFGGKTKLLRTWFPNRNWADDLTSSTMERKIRYMLSILTPVTTHIKIGGHSVDIYLPAYSTAIEFQGAQHYKQSAFGHIEQQQDRDDRKRAMLQKASVHLIQIPYWWNGSWYQLVRTLKKHPHLEDFAKTQEDVNSISSSSCAPPFPCNITLSEVREAIKLDTSFFKEFEHDGYVSFNYLQNDVHFVDKAKEVFMGYHPLKSTDANQARLYAILHECRGIKFSLNGELLCRPFHKFWNVNETEDSRIGKIDLNEIEVILEKFDGKLISPIRINGKVMFLSKSGYSIPKLNNHLYQMEAKSHHYSAFTSQLIEDNKTPIFEYVSVVNPNVVRYPKQQLLLLAIRDNSTGIYTNYWHMRQQAAEYNIPVIPDWPCPNDRQGLKKLREIEGTEGFVIKMKNGHMYKLKTKWYWARQKLLRHQTIHEEDQAEMCFE